MKIILKNKNLVKPAEATFQGSFPLSVWDQIGCVMHVPTIYFFNPSLQHSDDDHTIIIKCLHDSLAKVLVHFYPLTGRLRCLGRGRLEINCNSAGVELAEFESDATLADLGDLSQSPELFNHLFPSIDYKRTPLEELPLLYVQLTHFQCGGISLSFTLSHAVVDGQSALHFISEWARICRGESVLAVTPFLDRKVDRYNSFLHPPLLIGESSNLRERKKKTSTAMLKLTKNQIETLKKKAKIINSNYTSYEVVTAHMWRTACKARKLLKEQPTNIGICVDIRKRVKPALPQGYFGNAIIDVTASGYSGELISKPLSYAASKIRAAVSQVTDEYIRWVMQFMENQEDISKFQDLYAAMKNEVEIGPFYGNPNMGVISWITLPLYGKDFGWGKEVFMGPGTHESDGDCLIIPFDDQNQSALGVAVCLQDCHIEEFRKLFYADILSASIHDE